MVMERVNYIQKGENTNNLFQKEGNMKIVSIGGKQFEKIERAGLFDVLLSIWNIHDLLDLNFEINSLTIKLNWFGNVQKCCSPQHLFNFLESEDKIYLNLKQEMVTFQEISRYCKSKIVEWIKD